MIPVSCSTARFDDSNPFRGETRAAKKRNTTLHRYTTADWSPTVCIYTRARACAWRSFPFKYLPTKHSSPPLFRGDENCERIAADRERARKRENKVGKKLFPTFSRGISRDGIFLLRRREATFTGRGESIESRRMFIVSYRQTTVDKIGWNYGGLYSRTVYRDGGDLWRGMWRPGRRSIYQNSVPVAFRPEWLCETSANFDPRCEQMDGVSEKEKRGWKNHNGADREREREENGFADASAFPFPIVRRLVKNAH